MQANTRQRSFEVQREGHTCQSRFAPLDLGHVLQTPAKPRNCSNWCEGGPMRLSAVGCGPLDKGSFGFWSCKKARVAGAMSGSRLAFSACPDLSRSLVAE